MISLILACVLQTSPVLCPVMGVGVAASAGKYEFGGVRIGFCCLACRNAFESDPEEVVKGAREKGIVYGEFGFDPVSRTRIDPRKSTVTPVDDRGIRYHFQSEANRQRFIAEPKAFATNPKKEATFCFGEKAAKPSPLKSIAYRDLDGVRYYLYCPGCVAAFTQNASAFAEAAKATVRDVAPHEIPAEKL